MNIFNLNRQHNTLLFIYLYSKHYMFRLQMDHLQVLHTYSVKACGKQSNRLAGISDLSSHWPAVGQNETAGLSHNYRANQ
jgi:hypothetical protein